MGKSILITGCSHGIGNALARRFSEENYQVYAVSRNKILLDELTKKNTLIIPIVADITRSDSKTIILKAVQNENSLSIIHNAGIAQPSPINKLSENSLRNHFETNVVAPVLLTQHLIPLMKQDSRVIYISSGAADLALNGLMPYCASKAASERATHCFNQEFNSQQIYFANVRPGMVDTNMQAQFREEDVSNLPNKQFYLDSKNDNKLIPPTIAAEFIFWVMTETSNEQFSKTLWSIYNLKYRNEWYKHDAASHWSF